MYLCGNIFLLIVLHGGVFKIILELTEKVDMGIETCFLSYCTIWAAAGTVQPDPVQYLYQLIIFLPNILFLLLKNSLVLLSE